MTSQNASFRQDKKQGDRPPPANSEWWKRFCFEKLPPLVNFDNFSKIDFGKKPSIQVEKKRRFLWKTIIWYAFYSKFATLPILKKSSFQKKQLFFSKRTNYLNLLEKKFPFNRILRQICYIFSKSQPSHMGHFRRSRWVDYFFSIL